MGAVFRLETSANTYILPSFYTGMHKSWDPADDYRKETMLARPSATGNI